MINEISSASLLEDLMLTHDGYFRETFQLKRIASAFLKKKLPKQTIDLLGTFEEVTGEKVMPTMVEIWKAEGKAETVLAVLRARFKRVPREVEKALLAISDAITLESWAVHAATCQSMDEFAKALS